MNYNKETNESEFQYMWRLCSAKDSGTIDMTWTELAKVLNENLFNDEEDYLGESAYRKKYQSAKLFYDEVFSKMESEDFKEQYMAQKRELERLKIQYRDNRNAWNKQNYITARAEQKLDYLEEVLSNMSVEHFPSVEHSVTTSDNDLLIMLTDWHIGATYSSVWGEYNTDIARERLKTLSNEIINIANTHNSENAVIYLGGDLLSGSIHSTIQITNRENVIDQLKIVCKLLSEFIYSISGAFKHVTIYSSVGNHTRLTTKEDALHDERLDSLIPWACSALLSNVDNVTFNEHRNLDSGIVDISIRGNSYIGVHGDYDKFSKSGISNLCMYLGFIPYAILFGHLHTCAFDETNGVKMIRGGALGGSGDQYTIEQRLSGKPSQMVCVCNKDGVQAYYPIELD